MKKFLLKMTYSILYVFVVVDCLVVLNLVFRWNDLTFLAKLAHFWILALTVHQMEESRFPGGFVWNYNTSRDPEGTNLLAYPMNRLSWFLVDCAAVVIFTLSALVWYRPFVNLLFMFFGFAELGAHFGTGMGDYKRFKDKGCEGIYNPGCASIWFLWAPMSVITIIYAAMYHPFGGWLYWILGAVATFAYFMLLVNIPERLLKNPESPFPFKENCAAVQPGLYFSRFLDDKEK